MTFRNVIVYNVHSLCFGPIRGGMSKGGELVLQGERDKKVRVLGARYPFFVKS